MDEIAKRLSETSAQCLAALDTWAKDKKNGEAREALNESVHELRKVASRLEIEMAVSERDEMTQRPIPIPAHRDGRKKQNNNNGNTKDENAGNENKKPRNNRRNGPKKQAAGGEE